MNKLGKSVTRQFFLTDTGYEDIQARWRSLLKSGVTLHAQHHLLYAVLRGKNYRKCFTPITKANRLQNGEWELSGLQRARRALFDKWNDPCEIFSGIVSPMARERMKVYLPEVTSSEQPAYRELTVAA